MNPSEFMHLLEEYTQREGLFDLKIKGETINNFDFSSFYLGGTEFCLNRFNHCVFHTTRLTYTNFSSNFFYNCSFNQNDILKSTWDYVHFIRSTITSMNATKVECINIVMRGCEVSDSSFTRCIFDAILEKWMREENMETGHLSKTVFRNCKFVLCSFKDCVFDSVEFNGCTFVNTKIDTKNPGIHFTDCEFKTIHIN